MSEQRSAKTLVDRLRDLNWIPAAIEAASEIERLERQLANQAALIHALRQPDEPV